MVAVREHIRGGVKVRAHSRNAPGSRRELSVLGVLAAIVVALSASGGSPGQSPSGPPSRPAVDSPYKGGTAPVIRVTFPTSKPPQASSQEVP